MRTWHMHTDEAWQLGASQLSAVFACFLETGMVDSLLQRQCSWSRGSQDSNEGPMPMRQWCLDITWQLCRRLINHCLSGVEVTLQRRADGNSARARTWLFELCIVVPCCRMTCFKIFTVLSVWSAWQMTVVQGLWSFLRPWPESSSRCHAPRAVHRADWTSTELGFCVAHR